MANATYHYLIFKTACGFCGVAWSAAGVTRFELPASDARTAERNLTSRLPRAEADEAREPLRDARRAVDAATRYFDGEAADFSDLRLDPDQQRDVFRPIYAAARQIGWGHTTTYGALARELGLGAFGARQVGRAMAENPTPLLVPCHRVLAAGGKIGGFSAPGGVQTKIRMLELERLHAPGPLQPATGLH